MNALRVPVIAAFVYLGASCVAQTRYDDALAEVKYYQRLYQDLASFHGQCEATITGLKGEPVPPYLSPSR